MAAVCSSISLFMSALIREPTDIDNTSAKTGYKLCYVLVYLICIDLKKLKERGVSARITK